MPLLSWYGGVEAKGGLRSRGVCKNNNKNNKKTQLCHNWKVCNFSLFLLLQVSGKEAGWWLWGVMNESWTRAGDSWPSPQEMPMPQIL